MFLIKHYKNSEPFTYTEGDHYILQTLDNLLLYFGEVPDTNTEVPLQRIENVLGHFLHFTRPPPNGTLTDIKRVVNNKAVETLTQYQLLAR
ncbi:hypothetical protein PshuTeo2_09740 [Pseudomonas hunanensis]|nr:hypothetical protein [Pseudomonas hunanensis]